MSKIIWNENYWSDLAERARAIEIDLRNDECKEVMQAIADCYEHLAMLSRALHQAAREGLSSARPLQ